MGVWLSALTIRYRDFQHILPFMVQIGLYATLHRLSGRKCYQEPSIVALLIYYLNPMAGIVEGFRWSIIGGIPPSHYAAVFMAWLCCYLQPGYFILSVLKIIADIV